MCGIIYIIYIEKINKNGGHSKKLATVVKELKRENERNFILNYKKSAALICD